MEGSCPCCAGLASPQGASQGQGPKHCQIPIGVKSEESHGGGGGGGSVATITEFCNRGRAGEGH